MAIRTMSLARKRARDLMLCACGRKSGENLQSCLNSYLASIESRFEDIESQESARKCEAPRIKDRNNFDLRKYRKSLEYRLKE